MTTLLCGTDFSKQSTKAADAAAAIARRAGAKLLLAHAVDLHSIGDVPSPLIGELERRFGAQLESEGERLRQAGIEVETMLLSGPAEKALRDAAAQVAADLVIVSATGRSGVEAWLVGRVAERVAEHIAVPTLVVHDPEPLIAWAGGEHALKVLVSCDFTLSSQAALRWVRRMAEFGPCEITVAHVDWPPAEVTRLGTREPLSLTGNPPRIQRMLERELAEWVEAILGERQPQTRVIASWGRPDARLAALALEEKADLIVTGSHQHHGVNRVAHPSFSRHLLRSSTVSVVCVPAPAAPPVEVVSASLTRVLVATDMSPRGSLAIPFAFGMASTGGLVRLVHVVDPFQLPNPLIGGHPATSTLSKSAHLQEAAEAEKHLLALAPKDAGERAISTEVAVIQSREPANAICQEAERFGADVVCIGSHGHTGIAAGLLGSVAQAVLAQSRRPVLVVPAIRD